MAASGGYWREAATLIVTAKSDCQKKAQLLSKQTDSNIVLNSTCNSGTNTRSPEQHNVCSVGNNIEKDEAAFKVLMVKRHKNAAFVPNAYVFPGGVINPADFSINWVLLFEDLIQRPIADIAADFQVYGPRGSMYHSNNEHVVPPEIAFRICAIRETFEESGFLLFTKIQPQQYHGKKGHHSIKYNATSPLTRISKVDLFDKFVINQWRARVADDPNELLTLCREFRVVPNIWALYEWISWLTPAMMKAGEPPKVSHRFNTVFYTCCLDAQPDTQACSHETVTTEWHSPRHWLQLADQESVFMIAPQKTELLRLTSLSTLIDVSSFIHWREPLGLMQNFPVVVICSDGIGLVLPGDDLYPSEPDFYGHKDPISLSCSLAEFRQHPGHKHRSYISRSMKETAFDCNISLPYGLISPSDRLLAARTPELPGHAWWGGASLSDYMSSSKL